MVEEWCRSVKRVPVMADDEMALRTNSSEVANRSGWRVSGSGQQSIAISNERFKTRIETVLYRQTVPLPRDGDRKSESYLKKQRINRV